MPIADSRIWLEVLYQDFEWFPLDPYSQALCWPPTCKLLCSLEKTLSLNLKLTTAEAPSVGLHTTGHQTYNLLWCKHVPLYKK